MLSSFGRLVTLALALGAASAASSPTGAIVSAQFMCDAPCEQNWWLGLSKTDVVTTSEKSDVFLQQYISPANTVTRQFEVFTAYDETTRNFATFACDYPRTNVGMLWISTLSAAIDTATPVVDGLLFPYPESSSPYPLDVLQLKITRAFYYQSQLYVVFTNGEIHTVDSSGVFTKVLGLISDELQLGVTHPYATWSQVVDTETDTLYSVVFGAIEAYLVATDLTTMTSGDYLPLAMPQGAISGFSPETFINAHMVTLPTGTRQLILATESLPNLGFDQFNAVNMTSGQLDAAVFNLNDPGTDVILECDSVVYECDMWRVSAWNQDAYTIYFQGHSSTDGSVTLYSLEWRVAPVTGILEALVFPTGLTYYAYGYTGFQFVLYQ